MSGMLCSMNMMLAYVDAQGVPTGRYIGLLNPVTVQYEVAEATNIDRISNLRDSQGAVLDRVSRPNPPTFTFGTDELGDSEVLAWALSGSVSAYAQAGATVTEESTAVEKDKWTRLPHRQISNVVVAPVGGGAPYVVNVDYLLDDIGGLIMPTSAGAIATGNVAVSYDAAELTGETIEAGTRPSISVAVLGEGTNLATGEPISLEIPRIVMSANGAINMIGDQFIQTALTGAPIKLPGRPAFKLDKPKPVAAPGPATKLTFVTPIVGGEEAANFGPLQVRVEDAAGTLVSSDNTTSVALVKSSGPGTITVTTPVTAVNGIATFPSISADTAGDIVLTASAAGLSSATSPAITITSA